MAGGTAVRTRAQTALRGSDPPAPPVPRRPSRTQRVIGRYPHAGPCLGAGAALGAAVFLLKGGSDLLPVLGGIGGVIAYVLVTTPVASMVTLLVVEWSNLSDIVGYHSGLSLYFLTLGLSIASLAVAIRRSSTRILPRSPVYFLLGLLVVAGGASLLATSYELVGTSVPGQRLKDLGFFLVALALMRVTGRWRLALGAMVVTIAVLAGLSVIQEFVFHNSTTFGGLEGVPDTVQVGGLTARHNGPQGDPNFWGRTIVLIAAPTVALVVDEVRSRDWRRAGAWSAALLALVAGEYLTQSRGGFLALLLVMVLWVVVLGWKHRRWLLLLPLGLALVVVVVPGVSSRLGSLGELTNVSTTSTDPSLIGRIQAQKVAFRMFESHPFTGVGIGNFQTVEPQYLADAGAEDTGTPIAAHDLYLEIAAEQGIVGLVAWVVFFGGSILVALRAALQAHRSRAGPERSTAIGCLIGLLGWGAASAALHMNYFGDLLAIIAVAVVLDTSVRDRAVPTEVMDGATVARVAVRRDRFDRWFGPLRLLACAVIGIVAGQAMASVLPIRSVSYRAEVTASVRPIAGPPSGVNAYSWDTVSRLWLLPTLGQVMANRRFAVEAATGLRLPPATLAAATVSGVGDAQDAILGVDVTAPRPSVAAALAQRDFEAGTSYLSGMLSAYEIEPLSSTSLHRSSSLRHSQVLLAAGVGLLAALAVGGALGQLRRRRVVRERATAT